MAVTLLLFALGCSGNPTENSKGKPSTGKDEPAGPVTVEPLHLMQFEGALSQYKGKVVLVDVWSIT